MQEATLDSNEGTIWELVKGKPTMIWEGSGLDAFLSKYLPFSRFKQEPKAKDIQEQAQIRKVERI